MHENRWEQLKEVLKQFPECQQSLQVGIASVAHVQNAVISFVVMPVSVTVQSVMCAPMSCQCCMHKNICRFAMQKLCNAVKPHYVT